MSTPAGTVAIFGPGLMGGSLLMALRHRHPHVRLSAWGRREEALRDLTRRGLADHVSTKAAEVAESADTIVLCLPVDRMQGLAEDIAPVVPAHALVTDVGSVKATVVEALEGVFSPGGNFVGSHPMCGSEEAGLAAARADLYEGALCVITPTPSSRPSLTAAAAAFWQAVGARVLEMEPALHDRAAALASHVPHIAAAALVEAMGTGDPSFRALCAGGFRDTTRVASGSPELWTAILSQNRAETSRALGTLISVLEAFRSALRTNDTTQLSRLLSSAATLRAEILPAP